MLRLISALILLSAIHAAAVDNAEVEQPATSVVENVEQTPSKINSTASTRSITVSKRRPLRNPRNLGAVDIDVSMWRFFVATGVVCGICALAFWCVNKLRRRAYGGANGKMPMEVCCRMALDARHSVILLRVHNEEMLVACGNGGVTLLAKLPSEATIPDEDYPKGEGDLKGFATSLLQMTTSPNQPTPKS